MTPDTADLNFWLLQALYSLYIVVEYTLSSVQMNES